MAVRRQLVMVGRQPVAVGREPMAVAVGEPVAQPVAVVAAVRSRWRWGEKLVVELVDGRKQEAVGGGAVAVAVEVAMAARSWWRGLASGDGGGGSQCW